MAPLKDPGGLLADLVERAVHDLLAQLAALELVDELRQLGYELVHGAAVVAAHGQRELGLAHALAGAGACLRGLGGGLFG